jgi:hypothetical protein
MTMRTDGKDSYFNDAFCKYGTDVRTCAIKSGFVVMGSACSCFGPVKELMYITKLYVLKRMSAKSKVEAFIRKMSST